MIQWSLALARFSASKRNLLAACQHWLGEEVPLEDEPGEAALTGTLVHLMIETSIDGGDVSSCKIEGADVDAARVMFEKWRAWWATWPLRGMPWQTERAVAFDLATGQGRILPAEYHRDYRDRRPKEVCGTADLLAVEGDCLTIVDWRSTRMPFYDIREKRPQLLTLGLPASRAFGVSKVRLLGVRISADQDIKVDLVEADVMDLDAEEADLLALLESPNPEPQPGPHCSAQYCPASSSCKAFAPAFEAAGFGPALALLASEAAMTMEQIARAHTELALVKRRAEKMGKTLKVNVEKVGGVVPLGKGKILRIGPVRNTNLSQASILRQLGPDAGPKEILRLDGLGAIEHTVKFSLGVVNATAENIQQAHDYVAQQAVVSDVAGAELAALEESLLAHGAARALAAPDQPPESEPSRPPETDLAPVMASASGIERAVARMASGEKPARGVFADANAAALAKIKSRASKRSGTHG